MKDRDDAPRQTVVDVVGRRLVPGETAPGEFTYTIVDRDPSAQHRWSGGRGDERRADKRIRTRPRDAIVGERTAYPLVDCRIADRSTSGARLRLLKNEALPKRFVLTDGASRNLYRAVLIWQNGLDVGVKLTAVEAPR